jgi:hypothetical protein
MAAFPKKRLGFFPAVFFFSSEKKRINFGTATSARHPAQDQTFQFDTLGRELSFVDSRMPRP